MSRSPLTRRIRRDLADPRLTRRSIGRVAAAHGRNPSAFARLFRTVEGINPREFRLATLDLS